MGLYHCLFDECCPMTRRILCVQLADIGDLVLTTPALNKLRHDLPDAHITLLTTPHAAPILPDGLVDHVIRFRKHTFDNPRALLNPNGQRKLLSLWRQIDGGVFDTVIFFHHFSTWFGILKFIGVAVASGAKQRVGLRGPKTPFLKAGIAEQGFGAKHQSDYWLELVDVVTKTGDVASATYHIRMEHTVPLPEHRPLVAIHAGSGGYSTARRWEPEKFAAVAQQLIKERDAHIIFVGGPGDDTESVIEHLQTVGKQHVASQFTDLTGKTTLPELAGVLSRCDLFIGADSGVMQIATATGIPVAAVFGPSNRWAWGPKGEQQGVFTSHARCSPCSYVGTSVGLRDGCEARTCMRMVTSKRVAHVANSLLARRARQASSLQKPTPIWKTAFQLPETVGFSEKRELNPVAFDALKVKRVTILGVPVDKLTYDSWLDQIGEWVSAKEPLRHMCTVNPEFVMIAQRDINFYNILNRADLCMADGVGLLYAARYLGDRLPERVTGSDGVPKIAERAAKEGWRLYLLGAWEGVAERAADVLRERYPGVQIVGTYSGSPLPEDEDAIVERVNAANADILFVAYGAPVQDKWIARNAPRLNVHVAMGVGGTFDYIAGDVPLAPDWMRRAGLEWLFRLVRQPWRARRQLRLPAFVLSVLIWRRRAIRY
jgi:N-acetylglucosaminyldiphosphoundecaprenol N-acetyl-beta-D-mannosaminyltransferase